MDPFEIACPHCQSRLRVAKPELVGREVRCPQPTCRQRFLITEPEPEVVEESAEVGVGAEASKSEGDSSSSLFSTGSGVGGPTGSEVSSFELFPPEPSSTQRRKKPTKPFKTVSRNEQNGSDAAEVVSTATRGGSRKKKFDWNSIGIAVGIPLALGLLGVIAILGNKGYFDFFSGGGVGARKQDSRAFAEYAGSIDVSKEWKAAAPTDYARTLTQKLQAGLRLYPGRSAAIQQMLADAERAQRRFNNGRTTNEVYQRELGQVDAAYTRLIGDD